MRKNIAIEHEHEQTIFRRKWDVHIFQVDHGVGLILDGDESPIVHGCPRDLTQQGAPVIAGLLEEGWKVSVVVER